MGILKRFNKEQLTLGGALVLGLLLLTMGAAGGATVEAVQLPVESERAYKGPPARGVEFVNDKFGTYGEGGRNPFEGAATSTLALPDLKGPEPRPEDLIVMPVRPGPSFDAINRSQLAAKYRALTSTPSIPATDLPSSTEFDELKALTEPEMPALVDRRNEKEFETDVLHLKDGTKISGKVIVVQSNGDILFRDAKSGIMGTWPKARLASDPEDSRDVYVDYSWTHQERWNKKNDKYGPLDVDKHLKLARWAREKGMIPEAKESHKKAIDGARKRMDKDNFLIAARELSDLMTSRGDINGALALNLELSEGTIEKAEFLSRAGDCLHMLGVLEGAMDLHRQSINASPRYVHGRVALGRVLYELGRIGDAKQVLGMLPQFVVAQTPVADVIEGHMVNALIALYEADTKTARTSLQEVLTKDANHVEAKNALAAAALLDGAFKEASGLLYQAIKANQYCTDAWVNLGAMYLAAGQADNAAALFAAASQRDPSSADALAGSALVALVKGTPDLARPILENAVKMDPTNYYPHYLLGSVQAAAGENEPALGHFQAALQDEYSFLPAYYGAAMTYLAASRRQELDARRDGVTPQDAEKLREESKKSLINAETLLQTTLRADPTRISTKVALGCVYASQARHMEAVSMFQSTQSPDPLVAYGLGWVEYRYGAGEPKTRLENAKAMFNRGKSTPPPPNDPVAAAWVQACAAALDKVQDWLETIVRLDDRFEGRDGPSVGAAWYEFEAAGVEITVAKGKCRFAGTMIGKPFEVTSMERDTPRGGFQSFEATLYPENVGRAEYGIAVLTQRPTTQNNAPWTGTAIGFDLQGKLRRSPWDSVTANGGQLAFSGLELKATIADPKAIRFKVERGVMGNRGQQKCLNVFLWNPALNDYELIDRDIPLVEGAGADYRVMIWTRCDKNVECAFAVDNVRILERLKK
jgi:tetratricopeptide (TPR) repeat protein